MTREKWPRGRPKDDAKKTALLDAARSLLLARGPDVTIDEIAASAGIAKATVYANFAGKNALIEAVIRRESDMTITDEQLARLANRLVKNARLFPIFHCPGKFSFRADPYD